MAMNLQTQRSLLIALILFVTACGLFLVFFLANAQMGGPSTYRIFETMSLVGGTAVLGLASAYLWERRRWHPIGLFGLITATVALLVTLAIHWSDGLRRSEFWEIHAELIIGLVQMLWMVAIALPFLGLLTFARLNKGYVWIRRWTMVLVVVVSCMWFVICLGGWDTPQQEVLMRVFAALAIVGICATVAVALLHLVSRIELRESQRTTDLQIEITCPRCTTRQVRPAGRSECQNCQLKFAIEIEEEQCPKCGYPCYLLASSVCPECGTMLNAIGAATEST
jgi:hypothetical protein